MKLAIIVLTTVLFTSVVYSNALNTEERREYEDEEEYLDIEQEDEPMEEENADAEFFPLASLDAPRGGGECLAKHNELRALHVNTPGLRWDSNLAYGAQKWAEKLVKMGGLMHSSGAYGENLAFDGKSPSTRPAMSCGVAVQRWYDEISNYKWRKPGTSTGGKIGHFTQVVWKKSTRVGMGIAVVRRNGWVKTYIVARYTPAGNTEGQYGANVQKTKSGGSGGGSGRGSRGGSSVGGGGGGACRDAGNQCPKWRKFCRFNSIKNRCKKTCSLC